jgi:uncharacterized damage-inducible protein DinB
LAPREARAAMTDDMRRAIVRELEAFAREVELFPDDETLWRTLPGVTNSAGNLALHVCGNLKHFVGAVLGGTGYVRDRPAEFATREGRREDVVRQLRETMDVVSRVLPDVPPGTLAAPFPEPHDGVQLPCDRFLLHVCLHLAFHLGQAGYLRRALTGDARTSGAISLKALAGA